LLAESAKRLKNGPISTLCALARQLAIGLPDEELPANGFCFGGPRFGAMILITTSRSDKIG
jgi:hypothetical protein